MLCRIHIINRVAVEAEYKQDEPNSKAPQVLFLVQEKSSPVGREKKTHHWTRHIRDPHKGTFIMAEGRKKNKTAM